MNKPIIKMIKYQKEKFLLIITANKIIVVQGKNRGTAKCHPEDEKKGLYNMTLGLEIAIARLKEKKLRKRWKRSLKRIMKIKQEYIKKYKIANKRAIKMNSIHTDAMNQIAILMQEVDIKCKIQAGINKTKEYDERV